MPSIESGIDGLYQGPLDGFVSARTALAKTLSGDDAKRVKALQKPAAVAWAVNQVYWHARPAYHRLMKAGGALRSAQISALGGRSADVRGAADAHRKSIAIAVKEALRLASSSGVNANHDALTRTFEALSLSTTQGGPAGRLTNAVQPAGFEALAGIEVQARPVERGAFPAPSTKPNSTNDSALRKAKADQAERARQAGITKARAALAQAQEAEAVARAEWQRRKRDLEAAEQVLARFEQP